MKNNRIFGLTLLILLSVGMVFTAFYAPVAQARELNPEEWEDVSQPVKGQESPQAFGAQQTAVTAQAGCPGPGGVASHSCGFSGVSGESNQLKIAGITTDVRYVYLQCGRKVGEVGPPSCSCRSGFAYTYSCKRPPTVYITVPCH